MNEWLYIALFIVVGLIIPIGAIAAGFIFGPKKPNPIKESTYECGIEAVGDAWIQFKAQYYIFLFPWAVKTGQLGLYVVIEGIIFVSILVVGLVYTWRKGMLEWV